MPTNYEVVYGPIFRMQAVEALLVPRVGLPTLILVLDDTAGVEIEDAETILPVVRLRYADLVANGLTIDGLDKGTVTVDGAEYEITAAREEKTPSGRAQGLVRLTLEATT